MRREQGAVLPDPIRRRVSSPSGSSAAPPQPFSGVLRRVRWGVPGGALPRRRGKKGLLEFLSAEGKIVFEGHSTAELSAHEFVKKYYLGL